MRALVIDDSSAMRTLLRRLLPVLDVDRVIDASPERRT